MVQFMVNYLLPVKVKIPVFIVKYESLNPQPFIFKTSSLFLGMTLFTSIGNFLVSLVFCIFLESFSFQTSSSTEI